MKWDYYRHGLAAERLHRCYEIAPPRTQQYLHAEIEFVLSRCRQSDAVLELGCGYGRATVSVAERVRFVVGIDNSMASIQWGKENFGLPKNCELLVMDAVETSLADHSFNLVFCIQNGLSAFHVEPERLMREAIRVTKPGGQALFSSYSAKFWEGRLEWFRRQAEEGLLGEIDEAKTRGGVIVCKDGFTARTFDEAQLRALARKAGRECDIVEVDESSLFCVMTV